MKNPVYLVKHITEEGTSESEMTRRNEISRMSIFKNGNLKNRCVNDFKRLLNCSSVGVQTNVNKFLDKKNDKNQKSSAESVYIHTLLS